MKMSPCKVHLGMFQYCLNIAKLLNGGLIEPRVPPRSGRVCPEKRWRQKTDSLANRREACSKNNNNLSLII